MPGSNNQQSQQTATPCGVRCFTERKNHCKDLHKWGRNLLHMVGLECVAKQMSSVGSWSKISPFLIEDQVKEREKRAGIVNTKWKPQDWTPVDFCPVCSGKRFTTAEAMEVKVEKRLRLDDEAVSTDSTLIETETDGGFPEATSACKPMELSSTNEPQPTLNFDHLFGDGMAGTSGGGDLSTMPNPFGAPLYHPFQFLGGPTAAGFGQLSFLHQLMQWSAAFGASPGSYSQSSNAAAMVSYLAALQSQQMMAPPVVDFQPVGQPQQPSPSSLVGGGAASAFYPMTMPTVSTGGFDVTQWLPQFTPTVGVAEPVSDDGQKQEELPLSPPVQPSPMMVPIGSPVTAVVADDQPLDLSKKSGKTVSSTSTKAQTSLGNGNCNQQQQQKRNYSQADLDAAVRDIRSGRLGTRRASVVYGIPRSTLRNKIYKLEAAVDNSSNQDSDTTLQATAQASTPQTPQLLSTKRTGKHSRAYISTSPLSLSRQNSPSSDSMEQSSSPLVPASTESDLTNSRTDACGDDVTQLSAVGGATGLNPWTDVTQSDWATFWNNLVASQQAAVIAAAATTANPSSTVQPTDIASVTAADEGTVSASVPTTTNDGEMTTSEEKQPVTNGSVDSSSTGKTKEPTSRKRKAAAPVAVAEKEEAGSADTNGGADDPNRDKSRPKRGQYRRYDRNALDEAVKAVRRGEMSVHRAGSYYGVPHSTLEYKVKERNLMRANKKKQLQQQQQEQQQQQTRSDSAASLSETAVVAENTNGAPPQTTTNGVDDATVATTTQFWSQISTALASTTSDESSPATAIVGDQQQVAAASFFASEMMKKLQHLQQQTTPGVDDGTAPPTTTTTTVN